MRVDDKPVCLLCAQDLEGDCKGEDQERSHT